MASSDKPSFDVYGMLLLLGFLLTLGASLLLNDALTNEWGFKLGGEPPAKQEWHLTQYRDLNKDYNPNAPYVDIRKKDLEEWKLARDKSGKVNGNNFPVKDYEWPAGYKLKEGAVDPTKANNWEEAQSNPALLEQFNLLLNSAAAATPEALKEPAKDEAAPKKDEATPPADKKDDPAAKKDDPAAPAGTEKKDEKKDEKKPDEAK